MLRYQCCNLCAKLSWPGAQQDGLHLELLDLRAHVWGVEQDLQKVVKTGEGDLYFLLLVNKAQHVSNWSSACLTVQSPSESKRKKQIWDNYYYILLAENGKKRCYHMHAINHNTNTTLAMNLSYIHSNLFPSLASCFPFPSTTYLPIATTSKQLFPHHTFLTILFGSLHDPVRRGSLGAQRGRWRWSRGVARGWCGFMSVMSR